MTTTDAPESDRDSAFTKIYGQPDAPALTALIAMSSDGRLHTPVAREFDVSNAQAAYQEFTSGPHRGRIVLTF